MIDPREDAQAYIEEHSINKLFQVYWGRLNRVPNLPRCL